MKTEKFNHKKGSLMIEAMISISLLTIGLLGIFTLINRSIHTNKDIQNRITATYLAAEGIEIVKSMVDSNVEKTYQDRGSTTWNEGVVGFFELQYDSSIYTRVPLSTDFSTRPLRFDPSTGKYLYNAVGYASPYFRTIKVSNADTDVLRVQSFVKWMSDGEEYMVHLEDLFTNWRERTTPEYEY